MGEGPSVEQPAFGGDLVLLPDNAPPLGAEILWVKNRNGKQVRLLFAPEPKGPPKTRGTVIVGPGRTEPIEKYFEVARNLQDRGFAVFIIDWPGQGLSERMHRNPTLGHVRDYDVYVEALIRGLKAVERRAPKPWVALSHSMGGAIMLEALRSGRLEVRAAAFSAPMWGIPIWFFQRWYARGVRLFGAGGMAARPPGPEETFETNQLTHDEPRWQVYRRLIEAEPRLAVGEPTVAWVVASLNAMAGLFAEDALAPVRDLPVLIGIAEEETIVKKSAQRKLARRFRNAKVLPVDGSGHEILMETDARRAEFWEAFDALMKRAKV